MSITEYCPQPWPHFNRSLKASAGPEDHGAHSCDRGLSLTATVCGLS